MKSYDQEVQFFKRERRGTSANHPNIYVLHILPLDYPSNNLLKRRQKSVKNEHVLVKFYYLVVIVFAYQRVKSALILNLDFH